MTFFVATTRVDVTDAVLSLIAALCFYCATKIRELAKRKTVKSPDLQIATWRDTRIHELLANLRHRLDAHRTYLSQFHNGEHYLDDSELIKKTRTHESVRDGIAHQEEFYRGMIVSSVPEEMELVLEEGPSWRKVEDIKPGKFKNLCTMGGSVSIARCAVKSVSKKGVIIGFIGVDLPYDRKPKDIEAVCAYAQEIGTIIG